MWQIFRKELVSFFNALIAYMVIGVFLIVMGLLMWVFPDTSVLNYGFADMDTLFELSPYVLMFMIPAITMRLLAEERKTGTMEWLLTRPLGDMEIILGKFLSAFALLVFALLPTLIYYYSLVQLGSPVGNIDSAAVFGSYIGLLLLGMAYTAIGIFASSLTENQIIAFIIGLFLCFVFFMGFQSLSQLSFMGNAGLFFSKLGMQYHYEALGRGLIDLKDVVYYLSITTFFLFLTKLILQSRKW